jgi:hypothetical protein
MILLRPMSVAALLALTPAPVVAAEASPPPLPDPPLLGAQASRPPFDRTTDPSTPTNKAGETPAVPAVGKEGGAALPSPLAAEPLDRLSATRERPLFSPTRRPPPPPPPVVAAPQPPPPPPPPPDVALFGIVTDGDETHAVVRAGPAGKITQVRVGDDIGGWKVAQIEGRQLILSLDDRTATFMMFAGNSTNRAPHTDPGIQSADRQSQGQTQPQNQVRQNAPAAPDSQSPGPRRTRRR